jgi:MFS family permease
MREFGKLWGAGTISSLGDGVSGVAGPLLAAALTRDPVQVAGLLVAERAPWLLLTLPGGALVDRTDRRRVMTVASLVRVAGVGGLALAVAWGRPSLWLLYAAFAVIGTAGVLYDNAATAVLPSVIGRDELERANGRLLATRTIGDSLAGPPLGGWLFTLAAWLPFLLDAVAFVLVTALTLTLSRSVGAVPAGPRGTLRESIREGVRWLLRHRLLRTVSIMVAVSNVSLGAAGSVLVLYAQQRLGLGPVGYGVLLVAIAVGGVIGGLTAGRVIAAIGAGTALRLGMIIEVVHNLGLALTRNVVLAGVALGLLGLHLIVTSTVMSSLRQSIAPPDMLGRVHSAYKLLSAGGMVAGGALGGVIAASFGLTAPFWLGVAGMSAMTVWTWREVANSRVRAAREAPAPASSTIR